MMAPVTDAAALPRVAHVVRRYGGVTEPFIEQRLRADGQEAELWYERLDRTYEGASRRVVVPALIPGGVGDRILHRVPALGLLARGAYGGAERASRPDVIHAHYLTTAHVVGGATRAPLVASTYGFDVTLMPRRRAWMRAIRALVPRLSAVLVEGPHMAATLEQLGIPNERIELVPIAANLDGIAFRIPEPTDRLRVLVSGRLVEKKGIDHALLAFSAALPDLPRGSTLDVIGDGPLMPGLRDLCATLAGAPRIRFLGSLQRRDYLARLAESDLVIAPSRTARNGDGEGGAPTTILDAQATGVVAVGSTHADIPFLIRDGVTGFLVPEGNVEALRTGLLRAAAAKGHWPMIADAARRQVLERHSDAAVSLRIAQVHAAAART